MVSTQESSAARSFSFDIRESGTKNRPVSRGTGAMLSFAAAALLVVASGCGGTVSVDTLGDSTSADRRADSTASHNVGRYDATIHDARAATVDAAAFIGEAGLDAGCVLKDGGLGACCDPDAGCGRVDQLCCEYIGAWQCVYCQNMR
jgi:hypothetical protein